MRRIGRPADGESYIVGLTLAVNLGGWALGGRARSWGAGAGNHNANPKEE